MKASRPRELGAGAVVVVVLPLPNPNLSPNARVHWRRKAQAAKEAKALAWVEARSAIFGWWPPRWKRAEVRATFYFATNRRRDADNLTASMKAALDGIAEAGVVENDSGFVHAPHEMRVDKARPRLEITIREVTP